MEDKIVYCDNKSKDVLWYYRTTNLEDTFLLTCSDDSPECKDCLLSKEYKVMIDYPKEKYKYYTNGKKVVAVSSFAGRVVRGVATCSENDEFDLEKGKELAAARCAANVAKKRLKRAEKKFGEACIAVDKADEYYKKMSQYYNDALYEYDNMESIVEETLKELGG